MKVFVLLLFSTIVLLSGYYGGDAIDTQYRDSNVNMKRIRIPNRWRRLFRFHWCVPNEALLFGVITETLSLVMTAGMMLVFLIQFIIADVPYYAIMFGITGSYGFLLIFIAITVSIQYRHRKKATMGKMPRCFRCEILKASKTSPIFCSVIIVEVPQGPSAFYTIRYGKRISRLFEASTVENYQPNTGDTCTAIYRSKYPFFLLIAPKR